MRALQRARAGPPIRLRLITRDRVAADVSERLGASRINGAGVELTCLPADKMATLTSATALGDLVRDIAISEPGLDDLQRHFAAEGPS